MPIVAKEPIQAGQEFNIFTHRAMEVGQQVEISHPTGSATGTVVHSYADDAKYQGHELCGGRVINSGEGYYKVQVNDE